MTGERHEPSLYLIKTILAKLENHIHICLVKNGRKSFVNNHEALGVLMEEVSELMDAIRSNKDKDVGKELLDVANVCVMAYVSMRLRNSVFDSEEK